MTNTITKSHIAKVSLDVNDKLKAEKTSLEKEGQVKTLAEILSESAEFGILFIEAMRSDNPQQGLAVLTDKYHRRKAGSGS